MKKFICIALFLIALSSAKGQSFNISFNNGSGILFRTLTLAELSNTISSSSTIVQRIDLNEQEDITLNGNGNLYWCLSIMAIKSPMTPGDLVIEIDSYGTGTGNGAVVSSNGLTELTLTNSYQPFLEGLKNRKNILFSYHLDNAETTTSNVTVDYEVYYQIVDGGCAF